MHRKFTVLLCLSGLALKAQQNAQPPMAQVLERLDRLEQENQELLRQIVSLRQELEQNKTASVSPPAAQMDQPSLEERVTVEEHRTAEQAQTKVEAAHKFPVQLKGMLLFNAFANSASPIPASGNDYLLLTGPNRSGATVRQTLLGFDFQGPSLPGGGRVSGSLNMDFWSGGPEPGSSWLRIRRGGISLDWTRRSFFVGQDKPLISPYQPDSLAEVGVPPLAGSGNLWLWLPQARYEESIPLGTNAGLKAQLSALQTQENYSGESPSPVYPLENARPALEGRFAYWRRFDDTRRLEIAPGFHVSTTHVGGNSVPSHIASLDWLIVPGSHFQFSGTAFTGQNVNVLGGLGQGFTISRYGEVYPVKSAGGWAQVALPLTGRFTWNLFGGLQSDNAQSPMLSGISRNLSYASNIVYRLAPNVLVSVEAMQMQTRLFSGRNQIHNHYDVALGYLF